MPLRAHRARLAGAHCSLVALLSRLGAITLALAAGVAAAAPAAPSASTPRTKAEGVLEVQVEDTAQAARTRHWLKTADGRRLELRLPGHAPAALRSGARVRVQGQQSGDVMALSGTDSSAISVVENAVASVSTGEQQVGVLLVNFSDDRSQPFTVAQAQDMVFNQVSAFYREASFQKTWLNGATYGWLQLPIARTCTTSDIATAARQAAVSAGISLAGFTRMVYLFPRNDSCGWSGVGSVGGSLTDAWINGKLEVKAIAHELGHNLGLQHSHGLDCDTTPLGATCTQQDYGDVADVMGNTSAAHFNAFQKERLGWLGTSGQPGITTVAASGAYTIGSYETATLEPKALKLPRGTDPVTGARTWYYVEYRRALGYDAALATLYGSNLVGSLLVRTGTDNDINSSYLLDMTPGTIPTWDLGDAALVTGKSFSDTTAGVTITLNSADANGASVAVTLAGSACVRSAPMVGLTGGATSVAPGGSATYTVTVTSRDSSSCAAAAFSLQGLPPAGWSGTLGTGSLSLAPGASGSTSFTVGAPATAVAGSYSVSAKAVNGANTVLAASGGVTLTLAVPTLAATAGTNKGAYARNDTVLMSSSVSANGAPVAGAGVSFTLVRADGSTVTQSATTNSAGVASSSYRIGRKDAAGAWQLRAQATRSGSTANASSAFSVK